MNHSAYSLDVLKLFRGWLEAAIELAEKSWNEGGIPIGSVLVDPTGQNGRGEIVARGHNERVQSSKRAGDPSKGDPTAHAEVMCMRNAGRRRDWNRLTLVSTLSPCPMCSGAAILYKIPRVIVGENRTFMGAEDWLVKKKAEVVVLDDARCVALMERLKREKPDLWAEDIGE